MDSVEIVARFAGTILHASQLSHGAVFRIGTAPDVDLPLDIAPLSSFPLVDSTATGFVMRCPAGVPAIRYSGGITVVEGEIALDRDERIEIAFGRVMISITRIAAVRPPLGRPRASYRPHVFAAASLAVHLVMLLVAVMFANIDEITIPVVRMKPDVRPVHIARFPSEAQKERARRYAPKKKVKAGGGGAPTIAQQEEPVDNSPRGRAVASARKAGILGSGSLGDLSAITGTVDIAAALEDVGPIWDEDEFNAKQFGGSAGRFDPTKDPKFDSVKTGRYATTDQGRGAGEFYDLGGSKRDGVRVAMCDSSSCVTVGGVDRVIVREQFEDQLGDIVDCYERHAPDRPTGNVVLSFEIDEQGKASQLRISGLGRVGNCVADVARKLQFPSGEPTKVKYPLTFSRG